jgi:hypothetical protein
LVTWFFDSLVSSILPHFFCTISSGMLPDGGQ